AGSFDNDGSTMLSTLLHELGHSFGLAHIGDVYFPPGVTHEYPCASQSCTISEYEQFCNSLSASRRDYEMHCSESVMSYSKLNWTSGCIANQLLTGYCAYPTDPSIIANPDVVPGKLLGEQRRDLAVNQLVFPGLAYDPPADGGSPANYNPGA